MSKPVLHCDGLVKRYQEGAGSLEVLRGISFTLERGAMSAIVGTSGSGKSTLLNLLGGLDLPTAGSVEVCGEELGRLAEKQRCQLRNRHLGFIYQFHHLLPEFTAVENVAMPLLIRRETPGEARRKAEALLERVGLGQRLQHKPGTLSGGERQRVAIARALVTGPDLVLADEPTGNLDERTAASVQELILELNRHSGIAFLVVTHDSAFAERCGQKLVLHEGRLEES